MLSKNELKYIQSLCHKKQRQEQGLFIAEGPKLLTELLQSDYRIKKIYATAAWTPPHAVHAEMDIVSEDELAKMSSLQTPHQVLAIVAQQPPVDPSLLHGFTLVLDGIQDPGNLGTIIRIADWFGVRQIIASEDTVEWYNPKVVQSTMGSLIRVKHSYQPLDQFLKNVSVPVYGALLEGNNLYDQVPVDEGILIIGNESNGISNSVLPLIRYPLTIPRKGGAESLNAAVAAGILLSHLTK